MPIDTLTIVLVEPQGDANIGAVARAMKNFDIEDLRLVGGVPHMTPNAFNWAVGARDRLERAQRFDDLASALGDVDYALGLTRRIGRNRRRHETMHTAAMEAATRCRSGRAAIVFGREDAGLTNDEIAHCDAIVSIRTSEHFPSLNLAQAVLIACRDIFEAAADESPSTTETLEEPFLPRSEWQPIMDRLEGMLGMLTYEDIPDHPLKTNILERWRKLFGRAGLTERDLNMLEGLINRIETSITPDESKR